MLTIIKGWDIPKEEFIEAEKNKRLCTISIDLTEECYLNCEGCFTRIQRKNIPKISLEEKLCLIDEAADLGAKTVNIVGAGEPLLDPNFEEIIERINRNGMYAVVFTSGYYGYKSDLLQNPLRFREKKVSFVFKLWGRIESVEDSLVQKMGYSKERNKNLRILLSHAFNKGEQICLDDRQYKLTRIGADILVRRGNYPEILNIFEYCRNNDIMPIIVPYIPGTLESEFNYEEWKILCAKIGSIDQKLHNIKYEDLFYPQATKCPQSIAGLYVNNNGEIRSCVGTTKVYGIYKPGKNMLHQALKTRIEKVSFGCVPRGL
jgi:MoaA/NifB/PqqE/SkfB family radical SAM enzyme